MKTNSLFQRCLQWLTRLLLASGLLGALLMNDPAQLLAQRGNNSDPNAPTAITPPTEPTSTNSWVLLFPQLKRLPAPPWLREGVRVTYATSSALIGGENPSGSMGYTQYDLVALDKTSAVSTANFIFDAGGDGVLSTAPSIPAIDIPGAGAYWLNPQVLKNAEAVANDDLTVTRMVDHDQAGHNYDVVRFQYDNENSRMASAFDTKSGILVFFTQTIVNTNGTRSEAQLRLAGQRQLKLPWQGRTVPNWLKAGQNFSYMGGETTIIAGGDPLTLPSALTVAVKQVGKRYTTATVTTYANNIASASALQVSGITQIVGSIWLPPEAFNSKLRTGRIDRDPLTGVEVGWQRDDQGNVVITETSSGWASVLTYDKRSGALLAIQNTRRIGVATLITKLAFQK